MSRSFSCDHAQQNQSHPLCSVRAKKMTTPCTAKREMAGTKVVHQYDTTLRRDKKLKPPDQFPRMVHPFIMTQQSVELLLRRLIFT